MTYPITSNLAYVDPSQVQDYLRAMFGSIEWEDHHCLAIRGIGEKGTAREGDFREEIFLQPACQDWERAVVDHVRHWAQWHVASFIVPCVLKSHSATADNVELFTSLIVDLDSGDTDAKRDWLCQHVMVPDHTIASGGKTEEGKDKLHLYWWIKPTTDIAEVVKLRDTLARKAGGDVSLGLGTDGNPYGRAHQPIRIPGSCHAKKGIPSQCAIIHQTASACGYDLDTLDGLIGSMPFAPWATETTKQSTMTFGPEKRVDMVVDVYEGGEGDMTRWHQFSRVAGANIALVRSGRYTLEEAREITHGWMDQHMHPAWPEKTFETQWNGLVARDIAARGEFSTTRALTVTEAIAESSEPSAGGLLRGHAAIHKFKGSPPKREFIVPGLILAKKMNMIVAEGGAGKTYLLADLCAKVAATDSFMPEPHLWLNRPIVRGGTTVLLTTEDDHDEMHLRFREIDPDWSIIEAAGERLIVLPMINLGGAFPLVNNSNGEPQPSKKWAELLKELHEIDDLALVCVDTFNATMHGDENSAQVINEYAQAVGQVCGKLGAAVLVSHHIRKQNPQQAIKYADEMLAAVRGSGAITSAFRSTIGIWQCPNARERMEAMNMEYEPKRLYHCAILKANNPEMMRETLTLLRDEKCGLLHDVTDRDPLGPQGKGELRIERMAWMEIAVEFAAKAGHPYKDTGPSTTDSVVGRARRAELPPRLAKAPQNELIRIRDMMLEAGRICVTSAGSSKAKRWLDVPTGPLATDDSGSDLAGGSYQPPDWSRFVYDAQSKRVIEKPMMMTN